MSSDLSNWEAYIGRTDDVAFGQHVNDPRLAQAILANRGWSLSEDAPVDDGFWLVTVDADSVHGLIAGADIEVVATVEGVEYIVSVVGLEE